MYLYSLMSRMFPTSFTAKVFFIAFIGTHVPLLALAARAMAQNAPLSEQLGTLAVALVATLAGTGICLVALRAILRPLYMVERAMRDFEVAGQAETLPFGYRDEVGQLMERTNRLVLHVNQKIDETTREAETDPLTGVLNRRGFERRVIDRAAGGMLLLDLDHFKRVNDSLGHEAGDRVLVDVAAAIQSVLRRSDVLARFGGEEFVVFLPAATGPEALAAAQRIRAVIEAQVRAGGQPVTASIGVAHGRQPRPVADLLAEADAATYQAKRGGRNRVVRAGGIVPMAAE
ncbi:GGDEF domain-containing protein [Fertoebacter nigrum]|uniref:diguanylate cyclase n=1 Tax=Fertoeibacter niger TaxID=2656921 RepID=A0A8X8KMY2_9RHOB|nr:GGDEF domain-containing protein [Fertoeibacter niger]NUB44405.1 GGDEF domain-containing protein [Fertoeibacter niger]